MRTLLMVKARLIMMRSIQTRENKEKIGILSHLTPRYSGDPAYEMYKTLMYSGGDPMEFRDYLVKVQAACKGKWPCWH